MIRGINVASILGGPAGMATLEAVLAALLVVGAGRLAMRRWPGIAGGVAPAAALAGLVVLVPWPGAWMRPRGPVEFLVLPAAAVLGTRLLKVRVGTRAGRWIGVGGAWFAAWWVAGAAGDGFWRALAAAAVLALVLSRGRERLAAGGLVLWGGAVLAGAAPVVAGAAGVLAAAFVAGGSAVLLAVGIVAVELGAGRLARGRVGVMEVACATALVAPFLAGLLEKAAGRRGLGRPWVARSAGMAGAACLGLLAAWVAAWVAGRAWRP